jgi:hypothetical protein
MVTARDCDVLSAKRFSLFACALPSLRKANSTGLRLFRESHLLEQVESEQPS